MKKYGGLRLTFICLAVAGIASSQWMCRVEKIGPEDPSPTPISEIVSELANARTQQQVEFAIQLLLNKTGVGSPIKGSNFTHYMIPDGLIADIAETHLKTLNNPEFRLTWQEVFELEQILPEGDWLAPVTFEQIVQRFREQAAFALQDPETPNSAFLIALMAREAEIPTEVPVLNGEEPLLGAQDFLLTVWINSEFQIPESLQKVNTTTDDDEAIKFITVECEKDDPSEFDDTESEKVQIPVFSKNHETCLEAGEKMYKRLVKKVCLRKKKKKDCTTEIVPCVEEATEWLHGWIDVVCVDHIIHDQGGGDHD